MTLTRRELLRAAAGGLLTRGALPALGLSLGGLTGLSLGVDRALGAGPVGGVDALYDAVVWVYFEGAPSQTDTFDPKPNQTNFSGRVGLGVVDQDDPARGQVEVTPVVRRMAALANDPRSGCGLSLLRAMTHRNGEHGNAQLWTTCFSHTASEARLRPSAAACVAHWRREAVARLGLPGAAVLDAALGRGMNDPKGASVPSALAVNPWTREMAATAVSPADAARVARRRRIAELADRALLATRPDHAVRAWAEARHDADVVTARGAAANALRWVEDNELLFQPATRGGSDDGTIRDIVRRLSAAWRLVDAGVPFVCVGVNNNDTHSTNPDRTADGNDYLVQRNWGLVDQALEVMAQRFSATGKRVLVLLGGEFGRTPDLRRQNISQGGDRYFDGRDHHADGFSWALFSIGGPRRGTFRTGSVGWTGVDGNATGTQLVGATHPGAVGALVYRCLGVPVGEASAAIDMVDGRGCPLDAVEAAKGLTLMDRLGLARL